jgi:hypothetical protein
MFRQLAVSLFTVLSLFPRFSSALDTREIFKVAESSVVVVLASDTKGEKNNQGSGILIAPQDIVTSCKLVEGLTDFVVTQGSALRKARLQFQDKERDLCQLHIDDPLPFGKPAVLPATSNNLESGQDVFLISSPRGLERMISRAMVSGLRDTPGTNGRLIQIDAQFSSGSVGGGLFDQNAKLVGIVTPQFKQGDGSTSAIPVDWIAQLAQRNPDQLLTAATETAPVPTITAAQLATGAQLPAWMPRVGDRWKYKLTFGMQDVGKVNVEIIAVRQTTATERITYDRSKGFVKERPVEIGFNVARFQPLASLPGGYQLMELAPYAHPDTRFTSRQTWNDIPGGFSPTGGEKNASNVNSVVTVVARETVRVPAGEFKAWKIESVSERMLEQHFVARCTYWYAPEVKRSVKMTLYYKSATDALSSTQTLELESFEQGK